MDDAALDNPVWSALTGAQADFGQRLGGAARYYPDVSVFAGLADADDPQSWDDLATIAGPDVVLVLVGDAVVPPPDWRVETRIDGVLMQGRGLAVAADPEARPLGPTDVAQMLDLVARTQPGPFAARTVALGGYLGLDSGDRLIAMAGLRLRPTGWAEISAVCTDPDHRGQGLAYRLIRAVGADIRARGEVPFLHAAATNRNAIALYERMGFVMHRRTAFHVLRTPPG
jgi:ribosomal protein S18 acetylase RimI-like enzyme